MIYEIHLTEKNQLPQGYNSEDYESKGIYSPKRILSCFPNAHLVTDRFHVVKLLIDSLQHLRIKLRWNELDIENEAIAEAKSKMECWIDKSFDMEEKVINTSAQTIQYNLDNIFKLF